MNYDSIKKARQIMSTSKTRRKLSHIMRQMDADMEEFFGYVDKEEKIHKQ